MFPIRRREPIQRGPMPRRREIQPNIPVQRKGPQPIFPVQNRTPTTQKSSGNIANLMALFKDTDGNYDFDKIIETAEQLNKLYGNVSPLLSRFFKK